MADFVGHPFVQALAWTLVHFLWQGAAIGIVTLVLMRSSRLPWTRYAIGVGALAAMLIAPIVTLLVQLSVSIVADAEILAGVRPRGPRAGATLSNVATDVSGALAFGRARHACSRRLSVCGWPVLAYSDCGWPGDGSSQGAWPVGRASGGRRDSTRSPSRWGSGSACAAL